MDYLNGASDNEIAVIACLAAMVGSLGLMFLSGTVFGKSGSNRQQSRQDTRVQGQVSRQVGRDISETEAA